jgi:hypothetical protein
MVVVAFEETIWLPIRRRRLMRGSLEVFREWVYFVEGAEERHALL